MLSPQQRRCWLVPVLAISLVGVAAGLSPPRMVRAIAQDPGPQPPVVLAQQQSCTTADCHGNLLQGEFLHGPVAVQKCDPCHEQPDPSKHEFTALPAAGAGCGKCHELSSRDVVHQPFAAGHCTACHDPHHSRSRGLLRAATEKDLCAQCHEQSLALEKRFVHGPVAVGACSLCHQPHSSYYPKLLDKTGADACLGCHTETGEELRNVAFTHRPVSEDCSQCHDSHGSDHPYQLRADAKDMCLDCHTAKRDEIAAATVFHTALTEKDGCKNCHKTHGSRFPKLLDKPVMELCLDCHNEPQLRPDGSVVTAMGRELASAKFLHGPIREGDCSSCHNPHGSKNFDLLRETYPQKFYAPFDVATYTLCFRCHDGQVFTEKNTTTLTRFRNGDVNLHYVHVNKETKGRTCRACHQTHASNLPQHMAEHVPFGGWDIPIDFQPTASGGSCAPGCHQPRAYDYLEPLPDYKPREKK